MQCLVRVYLDQNSVMIVIMSLILCSGFFTLKEGKHSIVLDVVPMQAGQLFFPLVTLYKCMDQVEGGFDLIFFFILCFV